MNLHANLDTINGSIKLRNNNDRIDLILYLSRKKDDQKKKKKNLIM